MLVMSLNLKHAGFQICKVDVKLGINDVPFKAYKAVAIGVHQSINDEEIIIEEMKWLSPISRSTRSKGYILTVPKHKK